MLLVTVTSPARAFFPVAIIGAPQLVSASGLAYVAGAVSGLVGLIGMYLVIEDAQQNKVRIPLGPNENNKPPAPAADASISSSQDTKWNFSAPYTYPSPTAACQAQVAPGRLCSCNDSTGSCTVTGEGITPYGVQLYSETVTSCPSGYQLSGGSCTLTNARQAADDKTCDLLVSMGQFATADDMNCASTVDGSKLMPMIRNGKAIAYGRNSNGEPLMWEVTPGTDKYVVRQYEQVETATQTQVKTTEITVDTSTSEITSVSTDTKPGALASPSAQEVPTTTDPQTQPTTQDTPTVTQDETKPADKITCGLPGTPKCSIDDTSFSGAPLPPATSTYQPDLDAPKDAITGLVDPVITWVDWFPSLTPGAATSCHPIEFRGAVLVGPAAGLDSTTELDICPYFEYARMILGWLFGLGAALYIWRRFTGSPTSGIV